MTPPGHILSVLEVVALRTRGEEVSALAFEAPGFCRSMTLSLPSVRESHCHSFCLQFLLRIMVKIAVSTDPPNTCSKRGIWSGQGFEPLDGNFPDRARVSVISVSGL